MPYIAQIIISVLLFALLGYLIVRIIRGRVNKKDSTVIVTKRLKGILAVLIAFYVIINVFGIYALNIFNKLAGSSPLWINTGIYVGIVIVSSLLLAWFSRKVISDKWNLQSKMDWLLPLLLCGLILICGLLISGYTDSGDIYFGLLYFIALIWILINTIKQYRKKMPERQTTLGICILIWSPFILVGLFWIISPFL